jgi:hypothetical protein
MKRWEADGVGSGSVMEWTTPRGDSVNYMSSTLFPRCESLFCGSNRNFDGVVLYFSMSISINKQFSIFDTEF